MTDETNGGGAGEREDVAAQVAWALHAWSCPLCYANGPEAMAESDQDHVTQQDELQAQFLIGALGLETDTPGTPDADETSGFAPILNTSPAHVGNVDTTPDADDGPCDHATTEFVNDVAGWCCSHCGAAVDPDASTGASEGLSEDQWHCDTCGSITHDTIAHDDTPVPAMLWISHADLAARESAAATRARAEGAAAALNDAADALAEIPSHTWRRGTRHKPGTIPRWLADRAARIARGDA